MNDRDDGENFICDEEPHMLGPMHGYGVGNLDQQGIEACG